MTPGEVWATEVRKFRDEFNGGFAHGCELTAERLFREAAAPKQHDPRFDTEAPIFARLVLLKTSIAWDKLAQGLHR